MSCDHRHEKDDYGQDLRISEPESPGSELVGSIEYGNGFVDLLVREILLFVLPGISVVGYLGNSPALPLGEVLPYFWEALADVSHLRLYFAWIVGVLDVQNQLGEQTIPGLDFLVHRVALQSFLVIEFCYKVHNSGFLA